MNHNIVHRPIQVDMVLLSMACDTEDEVRKQFLTVLEIVSFEVIDQLHQYRLIVGVTSQKNRTDLIIYKFSIMLVHLDTSPMIPNSNVMFGKTLTL